MVRRPAGQPLRADGRSLPDSQALNNIGPKADERTFPDMNAARQAGAWANMNGYPDFAFMFHDPASINNHEVIQPAAGTDSGKRGHNNTAPTVAPGEINDLG